MMRCVFPCLGLDVTSSSSKMRSAAGRERASLATIGRRRASETVVIAAWSFFLFRAVDTDGSSESDDKWVRSRTSGIWGNGRTRTENSEFQLSLKEDPWTRSSRTEPRNTTLQRTVVLWAWLEEMVIHSQT